MIGKKNNDLKIISEQKITIEAFMEAYNKSIPESFSHATIQTLKQFQLLYPALFKGSDKWSTDKHRKKFMDWLPSAPTHHTNFYG